MNPREELRDHVARVQHAVDIINWRSAERAELRRGGASQERVAEFDRATNELLKKAGR